MSFLKRYLIALGKYKWIPLVSVAATTTAAGLISLTQTAPAPQYRGQGALTLNQPAALFSETGSQIQQAGQVITREMLLADNVIEATARQAGLKPEMMAEKLQVSVQQADETLKTPFLIGINYVSGNEEEAKTVVLALMQGMVQQSQLINSARLRARIEEISKRLPSITEELRAAEQELEVYNRREEADILSARTGSLVGAIAGAKEQQRQIRLTLEGVNAQIRSLEGRLGLSADQAYVSSALSADPIIANLRAQIYQAESQLEILRRDLRGEHPDVIALQNQLDSYKTLLNERAQEVLGGNGIAAPLATAGAMSELRQRSSLDPTRQQLANTLVSLQTQRDTLQQQVQAALQTEQQLRQEYATIPNKQLEQQRLAQRVALKKALFDRVQAALIDAQAAEAETSTSLRIERPAGVEPLEVSGPLSPVVLMLGGAGAGLIVGGALVFLMSTLEGRYYTKEELQNALRQQTAPLLEMLPLIDEALLPPPLLQDDRGVSLITEEGSPYLNAYERLRGNLRRMGGKGAKVILVTSAGQSEGKTHCAYNLAIASARAGKRTVLVEADLRKSSLIECLGVAPDLGATLEPLQYYGSPSDCIRLVPSLENLYIVPSTGPQRQPAAILESSEMKRLLDDCRGRFDFVVIDTPSILRYNDALLMEPSVDGFMVVTRPGQTQESMLNEALEMISEAQIPFFGVVINGADITVQETTIEDEFGDLDVLEDDEFEAAYSSDYADDYQPLGRR